MLKDVITSLSSDGSQATSDRRARQRELHKLVVNYKKLTMADYIKYVVAYYNNHFGVTDDQKYYIQDKKRMK